jgi:hypothetical protein
VSDQAPIGAGAAQEAAQPTLIDFEDLVHAEHAGLYGALWGARGSDRVEPLRHATCGTPLEARWYCLTCAEPVADATDADLRFV